MENNPKLPFVLYALKQGSKCLRGTVQANDPHVLPAPKDELTLASVCAD